MKHDNWPFNEAGEPLISGEDYARELRADAEFYESQPYDEYHDEAGNQIRHIPDPVDELYEEIAERTGHYHLVLTDGIAERYTGGSIIDACEYALTAVEALAYLIGEPYLKHDLWPTDERPSPRLLEAAECLFEFDLDAGYCARAFRQKEARDAARQ